VNEAEIEEVLHGAGVSILYPELVPFPEQLRLLSERRVILGTTGSALHTTAFLDRPPERVLAVSPEPLVNSNFRILDRLTGTDTAYFHAECASAPADGGTFALAFAFSRPVEVAKALLDLI
jgi:capsular polysaccharide biosynthesis protein